MYNVENILKNKNEIIIIKFIMGNPGCYLGQISKTTGIPKSTCRYIINKLKQNGDIVKINCGKIKRFYHVNTKKRTQMNPSQEIVYHILSTGCYSQKNLCLLSNIKQPTISRILNNFLDNNIVKICRA